MKRPNTVPVRNPLACLIGLVAGAWLAAAHAQSGYTPMVIDDSAPRELGSFGSEVAGAGDVNRDGIPDLLVGGSLISGADMSLLLDFDRPAEVAVGDVNGDGVPDFLGGAPSLDVGANRSQGRAFVSSGSDGSLLLTLDDPVPQAEAVFGEAVTGTEDVNGDGVPDLLVGAPYQDVGGNIRQGQVFVFSGADGSLLRTLDAPEPRSFAEFGNRLAGAGDVNLDGISDVLVGARFRVFVLSGSDGSVLLTLENPMPQDGAFFGEAVAAVGDVNVDGIPDFLVGDRAQLVGGNPQQGQAFVFSGADGSLLLTLDDPVPVTQPPQETALFGTAVAGVEDLSGDGIPELVVGAPEQMVGDNFGQGQVFVFSGADGSLLLTLDNPTPQAGAFFGETVAAAGDVNVDGIPDFLVGVPGQDVAGTLDQGQAVLFVSFSPAATLQCPGDINDDGSPEIVVTTPSGEVLVKDLSGVTVNSFALDGSAGVVDTELMADTNGDGVPELVLLEPGDAGAQVRDLLSGAVLSSVEFSSNRSPVDLEILPDRTGNGIPEVARLGHSRVSVEVRDGLTSELVNNVEFANYVIPQDLDVYPDASGNNWPELAVLGDNRFGGSDSIEIRDPQTGAIVRRIWLGRNWRVHEQAILADVNGNGSPDVAVLRTHATMDRVNVWIRDTATGGWVNFIGFPRYYSPQELLILGDINGNGADEVAVLGRRLNGGGQKLVIKDSRTDEKLNKMWFDRRFLGQDLVSCGDINGNGAQEVAFLGQRLLDGRYKVAVKDAKTGERLSIVRF